MHLLVRMHYVAEASSVVRAFAASVEKRELMSKTRVLDYRKRLMLPFKRHSAAADCESEFFVITIHVGIMLYVEVGMMEICQLP